MSALAVDDKGIVTECPSCGQKNRVPFEHLGESGRCGRCQAQLPPSSEPIEVESEDQFDRLVSEAPVPVLVDYWAPWCYPCRMVAPEIAKVAASASGRFVVAKVNTERLPGIANRYRIQAIPTLGVFQAGQEVKRQSGALPASGIEAFVRSATGI